MSASKQNVASSEDMAEMDAHEVQEALAEALAVPLEENISTTPNRQDGRQDFGRGQSGDVVQLSEDKDIDLPENPFAEAVDLNEQARAIEAMLFAATGPLDQSTMADRLAEGTDVERALELLQERYQGRGIQLQKVGRKWRFVTAPDVAHVLDKEQIIPRKLSRAALETLAIIAYHQPCTRADIEEVRGVAVSKGSLDQLMELGWVRLRGRRDHVPGRPILYGTSQRFLEHFGLESVSHLPGLADLKAAGLLDARLPPDFTVPTPQDGEGVEGLDEEAAETDFVQDFIEDEEEGGDH